MATFIILITLLCASSTKCMHRIVGGRRASIKDFPYTVAVQDKTTHLCGGALVHPRWVVSAEHCFRRNTQYYVRLGVTDLSAPSDQGMLVPVEAVIRHPNFHKHQHHYDIALVRLRRCVRPSMTIWPIKLPAFSRGEVPIRIGVATGWGGTNEGKSTKLNKVYLPVYNQTSCEMSYPQGFVLETMFCAGFEEGGHDTCEGDSGGPFAIDGQLYGIISWGFDCGEPGKPGVYIKVPYFVPFIRKHVPISWR